MDTIFGAVAAQLKMGLTVRIQDFQHSFSWNAVTVVNPLAQTTSPLLARLII
ncbi:hypothetical protein [Quisquiliibacterium transsilvanicum]|uniref:Uncharacterized protein n=1 Tax=Quisquiliibacterium transsilvanicum TaxID=1549638 RepID=A0A7W8HHB0_9BURK|nr:hypothetical protein [Quisquiliibacterium transsilvanicum]MBB5272029.1 hypothetical protein [Quisquiliibacterium transsilvanicum]